MTALALVTVVSLGDLYLQSLVPTSGSGAEAVLDGKADTSWKPEGSPEGEGILFRFEEPVGVKTVEVVPCAGDKSAFNAVYDGSYSTSVESGKMSVPFNFRSLFLKVQSGKGCVA